MIQEEDSDFLIGCGADVDRAMNPIGRLIPVDLTDRHYERRLVSDNGGVRWKNRWVKASHLFAELEIGFEEIDDSLWNV